MIGKRPNISPQTVWQSPEKLPSQLPITINDCRLCRRPPKFDHEIDGDRLTVTIFSVNGHWRDSSGATVGEAIAEWNYDNPPKEGE